MERFLINGKEMKIDSSMHWMLVYERVFRADALSATLVLLGQAEVEDSARVILQIIWALAKNSDPTVEEAEEWLSKLEVDYEVLIPKLRSIVDSTFSKTEEALQGAVSDSNDGGDRRVTFMQIVAAGLMRGLTLADTERLTLGMWLDYITAHNNLHSQSGTSHGGERIRMATQADINRLKR